MNIQKEDRDKINISEGFTLVELIVVMAIIGVLVLLASGKFFSRTDEAKLRAVQQDIRVLSDGAANYRTEDGKWPTLSGEVANADKLIRALGNNVKGQDLKALDEIDISKHVQSTRNDISEYVLVTAGKYEGQVFYLGDVIGEDGSSYHGSINGGDITSTAPIEYSHSELFTYISGVRAERKNGDGKHYFDDKKMYEFKNAEKQIGNDEDSVQLQKEFNDEKKHIYVGVNSTELLAGDINTGYYGLVEAKDFYTGAELEKEIGLSSGNTNNNSNEPWLKFSIDGKTILKAKKTYKYSIDWEKIDLVGAAYGNAKVTKDDKTYIVRLIRGATTNPAKFDAEDKGAIGSEWNRLMLPIHINSKNNKWVTPKYVESNVPYWGIDFNDLDLGFFQSNNNNKYHQWTQESSSSNSDSRMIRTSISDINFLPSGYVINYSRAWSPVLELLPNKK